MRRREFLGVVGGAAATWPLAARAQQPPRMQSRRPLIAWLGGSSQATATNNLNLNAFVQGLREFGHVDGKDIDIIYRWAESDLSRQPALVQELVVLKPTVIVPANSPAAVAARQATSTIPIVAPALIDPVSLGLAASYNRPGGNVTGVLQTLDGLTAKELEVFVEVIPRAAALALLVNPANRGHLIMLRDAEAAVRNLSVKVLPSEVRTPDDLVAAFEELKRNRVDGLIVLPDGMFFGQSERIISLAAAARLPALHMSSGHVRQGGLMSYGVDIAQNFWRAGYFVDRILKGVGVADLPIEFPTKLELVINLKTAKSLGLEIPPTLLARADEVIE